MATTRNQEPAETLGAAKQLLQWVLDADGMPQQPLLDRIADFLADNPVPYDDFLGDALGRYQEQVSRATAPICPRAANPAQVRAYRAEQDSYGEDPGYDAYGYDAYGYDSDPLTATDPSGFDTRAEAMGER